MYPLHMHAVQFIVEHSTLLLVKAWHSGLRLWPLSPFFLQSLIYGEVEFNSFYRVLRKINPAPGKVFYDLGSGTGKVSKQFCTVVNILS